MTGFSSKTTIWHWFLLKNAILAAKKVSAYKKIEVEVETPDDALLAASAGADIILLDNMNPDRLNALSMHSRTKDCGIVSLSNFPEVLNESSLSQYAALGC